MAVFGVMLIALVLLCIQCNTACEPGQIKVKGFLGISWFSKCKDCKPGTYQNGDECKECDPGRYSSMLKQTECQPCNSGTFAELPGSTNCTECPAGEHSAAAAITCARCPPGSYTGSPGSAACVLCPGGSYSDAEGSRACTECKAGMRSPAGSTSPANCTGSCSAGYIHTTLNDTVLCEECAAGTYSQQGAVECSECSAGESSVLGSAACSPCSPGTFSNVTGSSSCEACSPGSVTNSSGSSNCTPCPENTYSNLDLTLCLQCQPGYYSRAGSSECTKCGPGYYLDVSSDYKCLKCPKIPGGGSPDGCFHFVLQEFPPATRPTSETAESEEPGSTSGLSGRQIIAIAITFVGMAVILTATVYIVCWAHRNLQKDYHMSSPSLHESGRAELGESIANTGAHTYSSCTEVRSAPSHFEEENIYDVPDSTRIRNTAQ